MSQISQPQPPVFNTTIFIDEGLTNLPQTGLAAFTYDNHQITTKIISHYLSNYGRVIEISELFTNYHCLNQALMELGLHREDISIIFKIWPQECNPNELLTRIEEFLTLSQWKYFDLLFIHAPINLTYRYEQWKALEVIKQKGLAKGIGMVNLNLSQLMTVMKNTEVYLPNIFQLELSPFLQQRDLTDYCDSSNIVMVNMESNCKGCQNKNEKLMELAREVDGGIPVEEVRKKKYLLE